MVVAWETQEVMTTLRDAVDEFLAQKRLAVAGASRSGSEAANMVYRKLRGAGYQVFAVNPNATEVEGDTSYPEPEIHSRRRDRGCDCDTAGSG
jgi:predicted CoA-binding protein